MQALTDFRTYLISTPDPTLDPARIAALNTIQTAMVSGSPAVARIYADFLKERSALPAAVFNLVDSHHDYILDGDPITIEHPRIQIDIYTNSATQRETLSEAFKKALDGYRGMMSSTEVGLLEFDNELNEYDSEALQYRKTLDFKLIHYTA